MDELCNLYGGEKRIETKDPMHYLDLDDYKFKKIKMAPHTGIDFICSYKLCMDIIMAFLDQPGMEEHKSGFDKFKKSRNTSDVVSFLWYFEPIDGCHQFYKYEAPIVIRELKKWCKNNKLEYIEPEIYAVNLGHDIRD